MAQDRPPHARPPNPPNNNPKKRKEAPTSSNSNKQASKKSKPNDHRAKQRDARVLATQTSSKAFNHGALDVDKFVKAREYEIRALEDGMQRSRKALNRRAFQQVPKDLRRRGAAHDVGKVPKRLRARAGREMAEDNTPTVTAKKRKPTRHQRLRIETVKKLRALGAKRKGKEEQTEATLTKPASAPLTRVPTVKKATLAKPPIPKAKFRKRQIHKSWLPTHLFHAKRAHMTPPSAPLWKFALPLSPTQKSYRPTHRASSERGAVSWDTSYMATVGLEGQTRSLIGVLRGLKIEEDHLTGAKGTKWRAGTRALETMIHEREEPHGLVAPVSLIWSVASAEENVEEARWKRQLFVRVHPAAFAQLWKEVLRLAKVAKPEVSVEDLRFEIGSIEVTGPGGMEALLGALWPTLSQEPRAKESVETTWSCLAGLANASMLPTGASLGFSIQDPKLHFPPRTVDLPQSAQAQSELLELLASWPVDKSQQHQSIFDRKSRLLGSKLPSQKAVNRRKSLATPGQYPEAVPTDPQIPLLVYVSAAAPSSRKGQHQSSSLHVLAPWKAIQPIWYSLMYYPLSVGQQPRFGGLTEKRQLAFEAGAPWFPGDFPGTEAGWQWEMTQRRQRWDEWKRRPKSKRVSWESVQVGEAKEGRGEIGTGWACDWEMLVEKATESTPDVEGGAERDEHHTSGGGGENAAGEGKAGTPAAPTTVDNETARTVDTLRANDTSSKPPSKPKDSDDPSGPAAIPKPDSLSHLASAAAHALITNSKAPIGSDLGGKLVTIRITNITRGTPQTCARIYRLPPATSNSRLRKAWLALRPSCQPSRSQRKHTLPRLPENASSHIAQQRLAASLIEPTRAGGDDYPACPGKEDLVGFVTSGNFNLAEGKGTGLGCLLFERVVEQARQSAEEGMLCIVRNAGESVGRLARWDIV